MVDSKAVAVVTEGLEALRGEQRILFGVERWVVYLRILSMSGSVCLPQAPLFHLRNVFARGDQ